MNEPEFKQHITDTAALISGRNLRDQYDKIISDQECELHGWEENGETVRTVQGARNKRKSPAPDLSSGGSCKSTLSSDNSPWQAIDDLIFGRRQLTPKQAEADSDGHKRSFNPDRAAIDNFFRRRTMHEVARELKIRREDFPDDLEEMEGCTILEQFLVAQVVFSYLGESYAWIRPQAAGDV
jgi:hypothetical protein